jgi:hypothetical protein
MFLTITKKSKYIIPIYLQKERKSMQITFVLAVIAGLLAGGIAGGLGVAALFIVVAFGLDYIGAQKEAEEKASEEAERLRTEAEYSACKEYWDMKKSQYKAEILESLRNDSKKVGQGEQTIPSFQEVKGGF